MAGIQEVDAEEALDLINDEDITEDDLEEKLTPEQVLKNLETAWLNERLCSQLLESKWECVDVLLEQMNTMEDNIKHGSKQEVIRDQAHRMENDRVRFVICDYLRTRLKKIEKHAQFILNDGSEIQKLSVEEYTFLKEYWSGVEKHLDTVALKHMPDNLRSLKKETIVKPNLDEFVFVKVVKTTLNVLVEDDLDDQSDGSLDLMEGDQHLIMFKHIAHLVQNGSLELL